MLIAFRGRSQSGITLSSWLVASDAEILRTKPRDSAVFGEFAVSPATQSPSPLTTLVDRKSAERQRDSLETTYREAERACAAAAERYRTEAAQESPDSKEATRSGVGHADVGAQQPGLKQLEGERVDVEQSDESSAIEY